MIGPRLSFFKAYLKVKNPKFEGLRSSKNLISQNLKIKVFTINLAFMY